MGDPMRSSWVLALVWIGGCAVADRSNPGTGSLPDLADGGAGYCSSHPLGGEGSYSSPSPFFIGSTFEAAASQPTAAPDGGPLVAQFLGFYLYDTQISCTQVPRFSPYFDPSFGLDDDDRLEWSRLIYLHFSTITSGGVLWPQTFAFSASPDAGDSASGGILYSNFPDGGSRQVSFIQGTVVTTGGNDCSLTGNFNLILPTEDGGPGPPISGEFNPWYCY
jgi:hypothetical protein